MIVPEAFSNKPSIYIKIIKLDFFGLIRILPIFSIIHHYCFFFVVFFFCLIAIMRRTRLHVKPPADVIQLPFIKFNSVLVHDHHWCSSEIETIFLPFTNYHFVNRNQNNWRIRWDFTKLDFRFYASIKCYTFFIKLNSLQWVALFNHSLLSNMFSLFFRENVSTLLIHWVALKVFLKTWWFLLFSFERLILLISVG